MTARSEALERSRTSPTHGRTRHASSFSKSPTLMRRPSASVTRITRSSPARSRRDPHSVIRGSWSDRIFTISGLSRNDFPAELDFDLKGSRNGSIAQDVSDQSGLQPQVSEVIESEQAEDAQPTPELPETPQKESPRVDGHEKDNFAQPERPTSAAKAEGSQLSWLKTSPPPVENVRRRLRSASATPLRHQMSPPSPMLTSSLKRKRALIPSPVEVRPPATELASVSPSQSETSTESSAPEQEDASDVYRGPTTKQIAGIEQLPTSKRKVRGLITGEVPIASESKPPTPHVSPLAEADDHVTARDLPGPFCDKYVDLDLDDRDDPATRLYLKLYEPLTAVDAFVLSLSKALPAQRSTKSLYSIAANAADALREWQDEYLELDRITAPHAAIPRKVVTGNRQPMSPTLFEDLKEADLYDYTFDPKKIGFQDPLRQRVIRDVHGRELRQRASKGRTRGDGQASSEGGVNRSRRSVAADDMNPSRPYGGIRKRGIEDVADSIESDPASKRGRLTNARGRGGGRGRGRGRGRGGGRGGAGLLGKRIREMREESALTTTSASGDEESAAERGPFDSVSREQSVDIDGVGDETLRNGSDTKRKGRPKGSKNHHVRSDKGIPKGPRASKALTPDSRHASPALAGETADIGGNDDGTQGADGRPKVEKSEKRSESMTLWWAKRKAVAAERKTKEMEERVKLGLDSFTPSPNMQPVKPARKKPAKPASPIKERSIIADGPSQGPRMTSPGLPRAQPHARAEPSRFSEVVRPRHADEGFPRYQRTAWGPPDSRPPFPSLEIKTRALQPPVERLVSPAMSHPQDRSPMPPPNWSEQQRYHDHRMAADKFHAQSQRRPSMDRPPSDPRYRSSYGDRSAHPHNPSESHGRPWDLSPHTGGPPTGFPGPPPGQYPPSAYPPPSPFVPSGVPQGLPPPLLFPPIPPPLSTQGPPSAGGSHHQFTEPLTPEIYRARTIHGQYTAPPSQANQHQQQQHNHHHHHYPQQHPHHHHHHPQAQQPMQYHGQYHSSPNGRPYPPQAQYPPTPTTHYPHLQPYPQQPHQRGGYYSHPNPPHGHSHQGPIPAPSPHPNDVIQSPFSTTSVVGGGVEQSERRRREDWELQQHQQARIRERGIEREG